jgi:hypothetical protein
VYIFGAMLGESVEDHPGYPDKLLLTTLSYVIVQVGPRRPGADDNRRDMRDATSTVTVTVVFYGCRWQVYEYRLPLDTLLVNLMSPATRH